MAGTYNFTILAGADWGVTLTWSTSGTPVDLTSWHAHLQVRPGFSTQTSTVYIDLSDTTSGIALGGSAGTISLSLAAAATAALSFPEPAVYDLKMTSPSGAVTRLLQGSVCLSPEVTV